MALDKLLLPRSLRFCALEVIWGSLVSAIAHFLSLKACNSVNLNRFARFWSLKLFIILETGLSSHESVHVIVILQYLIGR